jgi:class 3 adenylate cyclase
MKAGRGGLSVALILVSVAVPTAVYLWLHLTPSANRLFVLPTQHFFIVTNIALMSAGVAFLVARTAIRLEQRTVLLVALGFMAMASLFAVHGITTPGVLDAAGQYDYEAEGALSYAGTVVGHSAYLSLLAPSILFAASHSRPGRQIADRLSSRGTFGVVAGAVVAYGAVALLYPALIANSVLSHHPATLLVAAVSVVLFLYAAWRQFGVYARTRLPTHGALVAAFALLAEAQVIMALSEFWRLAWWQYHVLMLIAVVVAIGALFVELDRRRGLERFLSAEVVERVVSGDLLRLRGERRRVTVMFADLRGSTEMAETLDPETLVRTINETLGAFATCVFAHGGMLDKFLGDGLMAIFGVVPGHGAGAQAAADSALAMRHQVSQINERRKANGAPAIGFGVGIHTGEVVLGAIGIPQRSEFTAVGDTVNTAARLQEVSKQHGVDIVLSGQTVEEMDGGGLSLRDLGAVTLRGKSQPVQVLTIT